MTMNINKFAISAISALVLAGCSSTTVLKDTSGSKIVDVLHAHYAEQILQSINRVADSQDQNHVNVVTPYNRNTVPLEQSYNGQVTQTKKIVMPDVYPQKDWRDDERTTTKVIPSEQYQMQSANNGVFTPTVKAQIESQQRDLSNRNGALITQNKVLRDDMKTTQVTAKIAKTQAEKEVTAARVQALKEKQRIETSIASDVKKVEAAASTKIKAIETPVAEPLKTEPTRNPVVIQ